MTTLCYNDCHLDLKADFMLANPPFNVSDCGGEQIKGDHAPTSSRYVDAEP